MSLPPAFSALPVEAMSEESWAPSHQVKRLSQSIPQDSGILTTDCKSLYDLVSRDGPTIMSRFSNSSSSEANQRAFEEWDSNQMGPLWSSDCRLLDKINGLPDA